MRVVGKKLHLSLLIAGHLLLSGQMYGGKDEGACGDEQNTQRQTDGYPQGEEMIADLFTWDPT